MGLSLAQQEVFLKGKLDFSNAVINFTLVHSSLLVYATNISLEGVYTNSDELKKQIKNIDDISSEISQISNKTQMLSINASIEAARVGSMGRGFAVVAKEIGDLSRQTKQCTASVEDVNRKTLERATNMEDGVSSIRNELQDFSASEDRLYENLAKRTAIEEDAYIISMLAKRLQNHADFIRNLINNAGKIENVVDHHNCALGKWYDANKNNYSNMKAFVDLYKVHEGFHETASIFNKNLDAASILRLVKISREILDCFLNLVDAFEEKYMWENEN